MTRTPLQTDSAESLQLKRSVRVIYLVVAVVTLAMALLLGRVAQLQWQPPQRLADQLGDRKSTAKLVARRGALLDREGRHLAVSHIGYRLFVDPQLIEDHDAFAPELAHALGDNPVRIEQLISKRDHTRYVVVTENLTPRQVAAARALDQRAIGIEPMPLRTYPQGPVAGQLIGFVGRDHDGLDGLEYAYNTTLAETTGNVRYTRDAARRPVWVQRDAYRPPAHGQDLRLSIDTIIQSITEQHLADSCTKYEAQSGEAIVMHAATGQVLAMANWPFYDPTTGGNTDAEHRRNRCVTDPYEPGSIFKPFIYAATLTAGKTDPTERIDCTEAGFWISPLGRHLNDDHAVGEVTSDEVLVHSSNIGMAKFGMRMGSQNLYHAVEQFGFGSLTGSRIPGESIGIVNPLKRWNHYSETSVPIGQEIAVTPIQMVRAFAAFANDGLMPTPTLLAGDEQTPLYQRALDPGTTRHLRSVMRRVVTEARAQPHARSDRYRIWGKTGTAQVPDREKGGYIEDGITGSFVCGAPLNRPEIVVLVVVHMPNKKIGYYGSTVAAPYAARIVEDTLEYLGVPEDADLDRAATADVAMIGE